MKQKQKAGERGSGGAGEQKSERDKILSPAPLHPYTPARFLVLVGIERETETVRERYEPGAIVDLSDWPADVIEAWLEQKIIASARVGEK